MSGEIREGKGSAHWPRGGGVNQHYSCRLVNALYLRLARFFQFSALFFHGGRARRRVPASCFCVGCSDTCTVAGLQRPLEVLKVFQEGLEKVGGE